jgi:predicted amidophosphoribosyltransferase
VGACGQSSPPPTLCVACREPVDGEGGCASCRAKLSFIAQPYCPRLGIPFVCDPASNRCRWKRSPIRLSARTLPRANGELARTLVHALKYQARTDLAPAMGRG